MKKNKIIVTILIVLIIAFLIYVFFIKKNEPTKIEKPTVKHEVVDQLYKTVETKECTDMGNLNENEMSTQTLLYLVFSQLKKDKALNNEITIQTYKEAGKTILGTKEIPIEFKSYNYDGYTYTLSNDKITREKANCDNKKYVSKLYGYSYDEDKNLEVNISLGYIENNKVYDLNGKCLGDYKEETLNTLLDNGTIKIYNYKYKDGKYYLDTINNK